MTFVLPSITDKYRNQKSGSRRYVGQVLLFDGVKPSVIAEVYGDTIEKMRERKHAVAEALKKIEEKSE